MSRLMLLLHYSSATNNQASRRWGIALAICWTSKLARCSTQKLKFL